MDRQRVIQLIECEISRKVNMAKLCREDFAQQHLEVAGALTAVLAAYQEASASKVQDSHEEVLWHGHETNAKNRPYAFRARHAEFWREVPQ